MEPSEYPFDAQSAVSYSSSSSSSALNSVHSQSSGGPQHVSSLEEQVSKLTAMFTQQFNRGGYNNSNKGGNNGGQGRSRGKGGDAGGARQRSTSWERLGISKKDYDHRRDKNLCYHCGSADHGIGNCSDAPPRKNKKEKKEGEK